MDIQHFFIIILITSIAGFLSGLLGISGGILTIPIIVYMLRSQFGEIYYLQQLAIGTSFAIMIFTIISSAMTHNYNGNIKWEIVKTISIPIIIGTATGALISPYIPSNTLQILFIIFLYLTLLRTIIQLNHRKSTTRILTKKILRIAGLGTGILSSWIGIGGGSIFVPFFLRYHIDIKKCLGTSSVLGFPIALVGTFIYLITGLRYSADLPKYTLGFIYIPYFVGLSICTILFAPVGAKISTISNPKLLKIFFAILLFIISTKMIWDLIPR